MALKELKAANKTLRKENQEVERLRKENEELKARVRKPKSATAARSRAKGSSKGKGKGDMKAAFEALLHTLPRQTDRFTGKDRFLVTKIVTQTVYEGGRAKYTVSHEAEWVYTPQVARCYGFSVMEVCPATEG